MFSDLAALLAASPPLFAAAAFALGLIVGSFLNVVIYRLPIMLDRQWRAEAAEVLQAAPAAVAEPAGHGPAPASGLAAPTGAGRGSDATPDPAPPFNLLTPRSACPACQAPIRAWQNVPVVSWLVLRGRCAACRARISPRYPLVELATGALSAWVAWHLGFGAAAACALGLTWALIALTGIDLDHQLLPDDITLPLLWSGLLAAVIIGPLPGSALPVAPADAILGAAAGYGSLWLVYQAFRLITGKEGMGYGDFKLYAALGAWLGWKLLPVVILLSAATGAVVGIGLILLRGRDRRVPIPFGPYLAAAGWAAMLYGDELLHGYLRLAGLQGAP
jgi:leader peptidase (prepilin peptidase)/N-methyltransferase